MATTSTKSITFPQADQSPHERTNHAVMRLFGAILAGFGVILTLVGSFSLFSSWGTVGGSRYYWAPFLGLPLIALGSAITQSEHLTPCEVTLYDDRSPRAADQATREAVVACERCHTTNPSLANFCNQCGTSLLAPICVACGAKIPANSRFCTHCGKSLV
jgi:ribosomal protein L40E